MLLILFIIFINKYNISINEVDQKRSTPLHWAVFEGSEIAMTYLISWGAEIDAQDDDGYTPLHLAIDYAEKEQNTRLVKILLLKGADRHAKNNEGKEPAEMVKDSDMRDELLSILSQPCFLSCVMLRMPLQ